LVVTTLTETGILTWCHPAWTETANPMLAHKPRNAEAIFMYPK
jgi:hypothetical protein